MSEDKKNQKSSSFWKWMIIFAVILVLAMFSIITAAILGFVFGFGGSSVSGDELTDQSSGNVALIEVKGLITTDDASSPFSESSGTSSTDLVQTLEKIRKDPGIKAVIFEINSPGGSGVAADEIASAIQKLNKTTVAYIRDVGASAAYWIASSTDHVLSNRLSIVGSIGVYASYLEFSGLLNDYNVTYQRFVAGDKKDFGTPFRKPTKSERDRFQSQLDALRMIFIKEVAKNRNMNVSTVENLADGFIFTGDEALDAGLIDGIGGKEDAIKYIESAENITVVIKPFKKKHTIFDFLGLTSEKSSYNIGRGIGDSIKAESSPQVVFR